MEDLFRFLNMIYGSLGCGFFLGTLRPDSYIYIYTYIYIYIYIYIHIHIQMHVYMCMCMYVFIFIHVCMHAGIYACMGACWSDPFLQVAWEFGGQGLDAQNVSARFPWRLPCSSFGFVGVSFFGDCNILLKKELD